MAENIWFDVLAYGCVKYRTHGLPCGYEIAEYKQLSELLKLSLIHSY